MNLGISAYFLKRENVLKTLRMAVEKGITFFELAFEVPQLEILNSDFLKEVEGLKRMGASFSLHGPWIECNIGSLFEEIRIFSRMRILKSIDFAESFGLNPVVIHPGFNFVAQLDVKETAEKYFYDELGILLSYAEKRKVDLLIENVPFAISFFHEIRDFKRIMDRFSLSACYDVGHSLIGKMQKGIESIEESIVGEIRENKDHISQIHLHNNYGRSDNHLLYSGMLDIKRILTTLKKMDFRGRVIIESEDVETFGLDYLISWLP